jgi:hypothetical protein
MFQSVDPVLCVQILSRSTVRNVPSESIGQTLQVTKKKLNMAKHGVNQWDPMRRLQQNCPSVDGWQFLYA